MADYVPVLSREETPWEDLSHKENTGGQEELKTHVARASLQDYSFLLVWRQGVKCLEVFDFFANLRDHGPIVDGVEVEVF